MKSRIRNWNNDPIKFTQLLLETLKKEIKFQPFSIKQSIIAYRRELHNNQTLNSIKISGRLLNKIIYQESIYWRVNITKTQKFKNHNRRRKIGQICRKSNVKMDDWTSPFQEKKNRGKTLALRRRSHHSEIPKEKERASENKEDSEVDISLGRVLKLKPKCFGTKRTREIN